MLEKIILRHQKHDFRTTIVEIIDTLKWVPKPVCYNLDGLIRLCWAWDKPIDCFTLIYVIYADLYAL